MFVGVDLPDVLVEKVDQLVVTPVKPTWPFKYPSMPVLSLTRDEKAKLDAYNREWEEYEAAKKNKVGLKNRSTVLRMIITAYFDSNGK